MFKKTIISAACVAMLFTAIPGFGKCRAKAANENPLVLEYLKVMQDNASPEKMLLPSNEDHVGHSFNNATVAMAFILKGEKQRAQRILDFYANATDISNKDKTLQNFFYNGEAKGFFQSLALTAKDGTKPYHSFAGFENDRWIGDMAWLGFAFKFYGKKFNDTKRYAHITDLIRKLFISFFEDKGTYGYVQSGWRKGDTSLHEKTGHHEGNIDCYAFFKLCGEDKYAEKIKNWLNDQLYNTENKTLPLDLYTWGTMSLGKEYKYLLNIPEDTANYFKRTVNFNGKEVTGFYPFPHKTAKVIWTEGTAHMSCACNFVGNKTKAKFYASQLDKMLIPRNIYGKKTMALPYVSNNTDGYEWADTKKGFSSTCAWYILAKNRFNPFTLQQY